MGEGFRKIAVVTGTRAEYGLLSPLMKLIRADSDFKLIVIATGMHLSLEFGNTYRSIEEDGFQIDARIETLLSGDTPSAISKSIGLGVIGFADAFARERPDLVIILGDRFECMAAAIAAMVAGIPIAHIHGGEITEGAIDDSIRHTITKMAQLHFVSTEEYRRRVIQLGESPDRVFTVGALGIDNILAADYASQDEVHRRFPILDEYRYSILVTLHPETGHAGTAAEMAQNLLNALGRFPEAAIIFTGANADSEGRGLNELWKSYCDSSHNSVYLQSLGTRLYLAAMREVSAVVGNSSSGILEAPIIGVPSVDIGDRQKGRVAPASVIHCGRSISEISAGITVALSRPKSVVSLEANPYWHGGAANLIFHELKKRTTITAMKAFYDN